VTPFDPGFLSDGRAASIEGTRVRAVGGGHAGAGVPEGEGLSMGGPGSGRVLDGGRRRRVLALRRRGLSLRQIAAREGVTKQAVHLCLRALGRTGTGSPRGVPCCSACGRPTGPALPASTPGVPAFCLRCLPPKARVGVRLKALRLAAGLTLAEVGRRALVPESCVLSYERGESTPRPRALARLVEVLGPQLVGTRKARAAGGSGSR
jgi:transcriptional regulator with XRE-family HTH domain